MPVKLTAFPLPVVGIVVPFTVKTPDPLPPEALIDPEYGVLTSAVPRGLPEGNDRAASGVWKATCVMASLPLASVT